MKKYVIFLVLALVIVSLVSYYFGVYSYTNKIFPFGINKDTIEKNNLDTAYYDLVISKYNLPKYSTYGGIDFLNDQLLSYEVHQMTTGYLFSLMFAELQFSQLNSV